MVDRLIVVALFDRVDLLDVTGPAEVFSLLRREVDGPTGYQVALTAETLDPVTTSSGVRVLPDTTFEQAATRKIDTLIVPGAVERDAKHRVRAIVDPVVVEWVHRLAPGCLRVASVCVGAHVLAAAGLLDGKRATTHWSTDRQLADEHPGVHVDADPIFIRQGNIWTGAGLTASLDLTLALVAEDFGQEYALRVARNLVMYLQRPSGQSQFSVAMDPVSSTSRVEELRQYIAHNLHRPLTVIELAEYAHISDRQLTRVFKSELGMTPAAYVESARVEVARNCLETTDDTLERITTLCGFGTVDTLARSFRRVLGITPTQYRERFRMKAAD